MSQVAYGIAYTPKDTKQSIITLADIQDLAAKGTLEYIRVQWVDLTNTVRTRILSIEYFLQICTSTARPGLCVAYAGLGMIGLRLNELSTGTGEYFYVFDLNSFRLCTFEQGEGLVFGHFQHKVPKPGQDLAVDICPRTVLRRIVE